MCMRMVHQSCSVAAIGHSIKVGGGSTSRLFATLQLLAVETPWVHKCVAELWVPFHSTATKVKLCCSLTSLLNFSIAVCHRSLLTPQMRRAVWGDGRRSPGLSLGLAPAGAENHQLLTVAGVMVHVGTAIGPLPKVDRAIREVGDNGFNLVHLGKNVRRSSMSRLSVMSAVVLPRLVLHQKVGVEAILQHQWVEPILNLEWAV